MEVVKIGVLACQGSFSEHVTALKTLSKMDRGEHFVLEVVEIRSEKDLKSDIKALIIPGGESTTLYIFLGQSDFFVGLKKWLATDPPVWGTCAGMILLSDNIQQQKEGGQLKLGGVSITTSRNYFGRQKHSFVADIKLVDENVTNCMSSKIENGTISSNNHATFKGIFIRAPGIVAINDCGSVSTLATLQLSATLEVPVAVRQGNIMVNSFHPELTKDLRFHKYFINMILKNK